MALRVVQWATGSVGTAAIKAVLEHPELELVGCWVHSKDKAGLDVGDIIGTGALGVRATDNVADILAMDADAVVYAPLLPNADEVAALLRSGKNVVSPVGWFYPGDTEAAPLRAAALQFPTLHPAVATVLTGARSPAEVEDNARAFALSIPPALWSDLRGEGLLATATPSM